MRQLCMQWEQWIYVLQTRRGSGVNTDWFPKRAPKAQASCALPGNFWALNSRKSPFLGFRVIQTGSWPLPFTLDEALQLSCDMLWKIWPISVKRWKPGQCKLYRARVCLDPLNLSNVCDFSWSWILREFTRFKKGKENSSYSRRQRNELKSVMHIQCCFAQKTN